MFYCIRGIMTVLCSSDTGWQKKGRRTVQLAGPSHSAAHQNSFPFCIPAILNRASLSQFPLKNDHPSPPFYLPL